MTHVVGALGSRPASSKGFRGGRSDRGSSAREPKGKRHAVDLESGAVACGTNESLRVFDDQPWQDDPDCCTDCGVLIPFE